MGPTRRQKLRRFGRSRRLHARDTVRWHTGVSPDPSRTLPAAYDGKRLLSSMLLLLLLLWKPGSANLRSPAPAPPAPRLQISVSTTFSTVEFPLTVRCVRQQVVITEKRVKKIKNKNNSAISYIYFSSKVLIFLCC